MSWIRGTSAGHIVLSNDIVAAVTATSCDSVDSVAAGGTTYAVGDLITLTGGTFTTATVLEVVTLSGSAVATARIYNAGIYSVAPGDPVAQGSTDGSGSGATFNLTYSSNGWTADRDTTWTGSQRDVILHGSGGGADTIYIGWRTYENVGSDRYNWELHGMTGYDSGLTQIQQPGISPGDHLGLTAELEHGTYLPLASSSLTWWLSVTPFRILLWVKVSTFYYGCSMGFLNRFATSTEWPYPLVISSPTNFNDAVYSQSNKMSGHTDPWSTTSAHGPMHLLDVGGVWRRITNATVSASDINPVSLTHTVLPCGIVGDATTASLENRFTVGGAQYGFGQIINQQSFAATTANLEPTPSVTGATADEEYVLFPAMLVESQVSGTIQNVFGELDSIFWFRTGSGFLNEDRLIQGGQVYRIFQNGNRTGAWEFLAIKEG